MSKQIAKVERSSRGLVESLFEQLDALRDGTSTPQTARAHAALANSICSITRIEMDYARFISENKTEDLDHRLQELILGMKPKGLR